jgi:regulation of enolase protein 1 (concanavalin A-like superfamily)
LAVASPLIAQDWDFEIPSTVKPPEIDGHVDSVWSIASVQYLAVPINGSPDSPSNCSGSWRVLWDVTYLYVIVDVNDNSLQNDSGSAYLDDSVEFYFDGGNSKGPGAPLSDDDRQYTFGWGADEIQGTNTNTEGVEHAQVDTATGWRIEMKFPWSSLQTVTPQIGDLIGIDCFINDDDDGGDTREYQLATFANDSGDWEHPSDWGTAILVRGSREKASGPKPADGATDVPRDVALEWVAGEYAQTHDVYLGTAAADVMNADRANPLEVLVSQDQMASTFEPPVSLEYGRTYYWRVDEINAPGDGAIFDGDVWHFTVEPPLYPIRDILVTASLPTSEGSGDPQTTVDDFGLNASGQHSTVDAAMWVGDATGGGPVWIQYDFGRPYKVYQLHIWNYNGLYETLLGFGFKDVTIEYATEPNVWIPLGQYQLTRANSKPTYTGQTIDVGGLPMSSLRITAANNWSGQDSYGLSEVQFLHKPVSAREPQPADGATKVDHAAVLTWRPGREATSHQIQLSTDEAAVANRTTLVDTVVTSSYSPPGLNLGTSYYWCVDEVNEAETPSSWGGPVWSFTTQEYIAIDDFESYTNDAGERIYETWLDGYDISANGSQVGNEVPPYAERTVVHGGRQAMPFYYGIDNAAYSETELAFSPARDWSANGADTLSLYYRGQPTGFLQVSESNILMSGIGTDIWGTSDQFRFVYKQLAGDGSIVARIDRLDNTNEWAKAGVMIRETLESDSVLVDGVLTPTFRACMQWRSGRAVDMGSPDATSHTVADSFTLPHWVKLTRNNNTFKIQHSADGVTWLDIVPETATDPTTITVTIPSTVYIGLAVCSHNSTAAAGVEFSHIATTGTVTGPWQSRAIGTDQPIGNAVDTFYLSVEDSSGKKATLTNVDPYAVTAYQWRQWLIPLSDLQSAGVDPSKVTKLCLGVGDKTKPSRNASGLLYIDDIAFGRPIPAE